MNLPKLPYIMRKAERQMTEFLGLNLAENTEEGELVDAYGLTTRGYPLLTQCSGYEAIEDVGDVSDVFEWDGKLVMIKNGTLYYNGEELEKNIEPEKKQFAVVNDNIIMMPDKICISISKGTCRHLGRSVDTLPIVGSTVFTSSTIKADTAPIIERCTFKRTEKIYRHSQYDSDKKIGVVYVFGNVNDEGSEEAVRTHLRDNKSFETLEKELRTIVDYQWPGVEIAPLKVGDIIAVCEDKYGKTSIISGNVSYNGTLEASGSYYPDILLSNTDGYYGVITEMTDNETNASLTGNIITEKITWSYDVRDANKSNAPLSESFEVGDFVDIKCERSYHYSSSSNPIIVEDSNYNFEHIKITSINKETNTISFDSGTFPICECKLDSSLNNEAVQIHARFKSNALEDRVYYYATGVSANAGNYLKVYEDELRVCSSSGAVLNEYKYIKKTASADNARNVNGYVPLNITITAPFPELDYICSSNNRLWGVSNKDNTIYASSLGQPHDFYSFEGVDTDSYSLAVPSDGDFTAICAYGDNILCFKEDLLHKIVGDMPSDYYKVDYNIAGVQKGCNHSLAIINETLYYKGVFGVYTYKGGVPSLISYKLGNGIFGEGIGGAYNNCYFLSMRDENGKSGVYVYDITHGLWMKEDKRYFDAYATVDQALYTVIEGKLYKKGGEPDEWMAEFVPFNETVHSKKGYTKLLLRLDMEEKSHFKLEIKEDRAPWRVVHTQSATNAATLNIPLRIGRCDRFAVRLSGKGKVTIRSMVREVYIGSEK